MTFETNERPRVIDLQRLNNQHPEYTICPTCHGHRGTIEMRKPEEGDILPVYKLIDCPMCHGERVLPRA